MLHILDFGVELRILDNPLWEPIFFVWSKRRDAVSCARSVTPFVPKGDVRL
jgi:hypothetical protein